MKCRCYSQESERKGTRQSAESKKSEAEEWGNSTGKQMLTACRRWCQAEPWPGAATHGFIAAAKAVWSYCEPCLCKCFPYLSFNFQSRNNFWNLNLFFSEKNFFLFFMYRMCIARERTLYFTFIRLSFFKAGSGLWLDGGIVPLFTVSEVYEDWKTGA